MSSLVNAIVNRIKPYFKYVLLFVILVIFMYAGYYGYKKWGAPKVDSNKFRDVANADRRSSGVDVYFFHVDWCPHCKKAEPEWKKFADEYDGKTVNGNKISCHSIDCTDDGKNDPTIAEIIQKNNIQSYPTLKLAKDNGEIIEFDSKITKDSLETFVNSVLA